MGQDLHAARQISTLHMAECRFLRNSILGGLHASQMLCSGGKNGLDLSRRPDLLLTLCIINPFPSGTVCG